VKKKEQKGEEVRIKQHGGKHLHDNNNLPAKVVKNLSLVVASA
jgi:hypothetical protein